MALKFINCRLLFLLPQFAFIHGPAIIFYYYVALGWQNRSGLRRILRERDFNLFPISKLYFCAQK